METHDPKTYMQMARPFATRQESDDAMIAFIKDVEEARTKHRIKEFVGFLQVHVDGDDAGAYGAEIRLGNSLEHEALAARLLGVIQEWRRSKISKIIGGGQ
jgi:hypothetical protein